MIEAGEFGVDLHPVIFGDLQIEAVSYKSDYIVLCFGGINAFGVISMSQLDSLNAGRSRIPGCYMSGANDW